MAIEDSTFLIHKKTANAKSAALFIHGFTGNSVKTWGDFPDLVVMDDALGDYDVYSWGYPSTLNLTYILTKSLWTDDPDIKTLGSGLRTVLNNALPNYKKLVLVGHSMGGLVIQSYILEALAAQKPEGIGRITEVVLFGTPSGGLKKASPAAFLKNQIEDMAAYGSFIQTLRREWKRLVDDRRLERTPGVNFRLTLVAGLKDKFVSTESALDPFPFDEKELVPGDHVDIVKPTSVDDLANQVLKKRLLRSTPSAVELALIYGRTEEAVRCMNRLKAAMELGDAEELMDLADAALAQSPPRMPIVERELGLALSGCERYEPAVKLLERYLDFTMPGSGDRPFRADARAVQQLAVAMSGTGDNTGALARLNELDPQVRNLSETMGIRAGRIKREWLKNPTSMSLGRRALVTYKTAFETAKAESDPDQVMYNGINTAFLTFALDRSGYDTVCEEILSLIQMLAEPDYWADATRGEALLLLREYEGAGDAYQAAVTHAPVSRYLATTAQQARHILKFQDTPPEAKPVTDLLSREFPYVDTEVELPEEA
ncbi:MAG: tetratricopeptide repeat-containing protein [Pseudomonadota bacterium]